VQRRGGVTPPQGRLAGVTLPQFRLELNRPPPFVRTKSLKSEEHHALLSKKKKSTLLDKIHGF
jgi:hypothetical protein